jgi:hypothetical protein
MTSRYLSARLVIVLVFSSVLAACGTSGPSKSEAATAISEQLLPFHFDITVHDLKCKKDDAGTFDCQVFYTAFNPGENEGKDHIYEYLFIKLGGKWRAKFADGQ